MDKCNFTLNHYKDMLLFAKKKGYIICPLKEYNKKIKKKRVIFLRHDIDFNLENALPIAKIESKLKINSTYYIRLHSNYNALSLKNYFIIKKIKDAGHEIGLHFEYGFAQLNKQKTIDLLKKDIGIIEGAIGKIDGISTHEPRRAGNIITDNLVNKVGLKYHAYSSKYIKNVKYISDSGGRWYKSCLCEFIKRGEPKLCVLTHPIWWYKTNPIENY